MSSALIKLKWAPAQYSAPGITCVIAAAPVYCMRSTAGGRVMIDIRVCTRHVVCGRRVCVGYLHYIRIKLGSDVI